MMLRLPKSNGFFGEKGLILGFSLRNGDIVLFYVFPCFNGGYGSSRTTTLRYSYLISQIVLRGPRFIISDAIERATIYNFS